MNLHHSTVSRRLMIVALLLVIIAAAATSTNPVAASAQTAAVQVSAPNRITNPVLAVGSDSAFLRKTLSASLVKVAFQPDGLYVAAKFNAVNLKGETIRMSMFFGWGNGSWMEPNPDTPADFISPGGYLTQQYTSVADYSNSEWAYVEYFIPWAYFPRVNQNSSVFLVAYVGLDGQQYVASSWRQYFVLLPPSE